MFCATPVVFDIMAEPSAGSPSAPARWQPGPAHSDAAWILRKDFIAPVTFRETLSEPPLTLQLPFCPFPSARERNYNGRVRTTLKL